MEKTDCLYTVLSQKELLLVAESLLFILHSQIMYVQCTLYSLYITLPDNVCTMYIVLDIHYYTPR